MDHPVDAVFVESRNPQTNRSFTDATVANDQFIGSSDHEQMHRIEPPETLEIGTAIHRPFQLREGTVLRIGKIVITSDPSP